MAIVSADLLPYVSSLVVDSKKEFSMYRVKKIKDKTKLVPSDHFPLVIKLKNLPTKWIKTEQESYWHLNKLDGWKKFLELQSEVKEKGDAIIADRNLTIYEVDKKLDSIQTKIKFQAFRKTKPRTESYKKRRLEIGHTSSCGMESEEARKREILKKQNDIIEESINKIKSKRFGRQISVFKMKDIIAGQKKAKQEAHAVLDSETGEKVVSVEEIKRVNLEHCMKVLKHNKLSKDAEKLTTVETEKHNQIMEEKTTDVESNVTKDQFETVVKQLKDRNKRSYDFLTKAGADFQDSTFKLCERMIKEESFPTRFSKTTLYSLWKKGESIGFE